MPLKLLGVSKDQREKRLNELLEFIDLKHKKMLFQMNSREVKSNVSVLHAPWPTTPKFYFVMKQPLRLIHKPRNLFLLCLKRLIKSKGLPLSWLRMKWM